MPPPGNPTTTGLASATSASARASCRPASERSSNIGGLLGTGFGRGFGAAAFHPLRTNQRDVSAAFQGQKSRSGQEPGPSGQTESALSRAAAAKTQPMVANFLAPAAGGARRLRELLAADEPVLAPGVYDGLGARLVEEAGFSAVYMTGFGTAASLLGRPDVGLATMS